MNNIMGAALLGELLGALARSAALRTSLEGIPAEQADAVVRAMVGEIERLAAEGAAAPLTPMPPKPALFPTATSPPRQEGKVRKSFPAPAPAPVPPPTVVAKEPVAAPRPASSPAPVVVAKEPVAAPHPASSPAPVVVAKEPVAAPQPAPVGSAPVPPPAHREPRRPEVPLTVAAPERPKVALPAIEPAPPEPPSPLRIPSARVAASFDTDTAFVLAAALISLKDTPAPEPFTIGVPGVERGSEIFAFDHAGMRFFLSTLKNQEASVSRTGMLLLGKQESIRHRGVHESLVNGLRTQSLILPAEPGTVVFGRNDLVRRVDFRRDALFEILVALSTLSTWRVHASVLDASVQKILPAETAPARTGRHESDRSRVSASTKKTDIRSLERLLNREKKLAEAILQRLAAAADGHTVESMVGLASGSSEDWKPILKASFEVPAGRFTRFAQAVVDCQEAHAMFEPMLTVVGGPGSFSLSM